MHELRRGELSGRWNPDRWPSNNNACLPTARGTACPAGQVKAAVRFRLRSRALTSLGSDTCLSLTSMDCSTNLNCQPCNGQCISINSICNEGPTGGSSSTTGQLTERPFHFTRRSADTNLPCNEILSDFQCFGRCTWDMTLQQCRQPECRDLFGQAPIGINVGDSLMQSQCADAGCVFIDDMTPCSPPGWCMCCQFPFPDRGSRHRLGMCFVQSHLLSAQPLPLRHHGS